MDKPLRILAVVNVAWDPRLGAPRVWIELVEEWKKAGHQVEKFCLTDAFPVPTSSAPLAAFRLLLFPFRAASFVRKNAERFDVIDALIGTLPFSKKSLRLRRQLLVARSVGLYRLYEKFEKTAAKRWQLPRGKWSGRVFYRIVNWRIRMASDASLKHCDLVNLPNSDEVACLRDEMHLAKPLLLQPYGIGPTRRAALGAAAAPAESRWRAKKVCFVGMWSPRKGAKDWKEIMQRVRAWVPEARFLFLGTMLDNQSVLRDLDLKEPPDYVELVPLFDPDALPSLLADSTVGAFPSYVEGFGMSVVEQLAALLPTVAYDAPGPRDILRETLPELLVPAGNVQAFSDTLIALLEADLAAYRELAERSRQTAERFSWPAIARATIEEYRLRLGQSGE